MSLENKSYVFRGRNKRTRITRLVCTILIMLMLIFIINSKYISYLFLQKEYVPQNAKIVERKSSGRGISKMLVEYQSNNGIRTQAWVEQCFGDEIGKEIIVGVTEKKEVLRIYPSIRAILISWLAVMFILREIIMQFGTRPKKINSVDAKVKEIKNGICDGIKMEYIICYYTDENGKTHYFNSEMIPYKINLEVGDMVEVMVNPKDFSSYFVQLDGDSVSSIRL